MSIINKDLKKLLERAEAQGFTHDLTKSGHPRIWKGDVFVTTFAGTASDRRGMRNGIAAMKRHGYK